MADLAATARALLAALRSLGADAAAAAFEGEFTANRWVLTTEDIAKLNDGISTATRDWHEAQHQPELPACLRLFESFLMPIEGHHRILTALSELGRVESFESCGNVLTEIFVEVLGFSEQLVDVTDRLKTQKSLSRLSTLAVFEGFVVSIAQMDIEVPYSTTYEPIFRLYPYGMCVVVNPKRRIVRFVYTHGQQQGKRQLAYRSFVGAPRGRSANDNLLVWTRRLDLFRPEFGDDQSKLRDRVEGALACTPGDLAKWWPSEIFTTTSAPPGPSWQQLAQVEADSAIQAGSSERLHWGLESVFRDRFPMPVSKGAGELDYLGYRLSSTSEHEMSGANVVLELQLKVLEEAHGPLERQIELPCVVPLPSLDGSIEIDGLPYLFEPSVRSDGALAPRLLEEDADDLLSSYTDQFLDVDAEDSADEVDELDEDTPDVAGASLRVLIETAVSRKLAALASRLRRIPQSYFDGERSIQRSLFSFADQCGNVLLYSKPFLLAALVPVNAASPQRPQRSIVEQPPRMLARPPAWACLDASAAETVGRWHPIRATRLHPTGELAVPQKTESGWRLQVAHDDALSVNGRLNRSGPADWWIAEHLVAWGSLRPGVVEQPVKLLRHGATTTNETLCVVTTRSPSTESLTACPRCLDQPLTSICDCREPSEHAHPVLYVSPSYLRELERKNSHTRTLLIEIPGETDGEKPRLNNALLGHELEPGAAWLEVPAQVWSGAQPPQWPRVVEALAKIVSRPLRSPVYVCRAPSGFRGRVRRMRSQPIFGRYGQSVGWRVELSITVLPRYTSALLPDGRAASVRRLPREDAPQEIGSGDHCRLVLFDPVGTQRAETSQPCIDGRTGEAYEHSFLNGNVGWLPKLPDQDSERTPRYRLLDNEPSARWTELSLTEDQRRWLRFAHPKLAREIEQQSQRGGSGSAPWEAALGAILSDLDLHGARPFVATEAVVAGASRPEEARESLTDPIRTRIHQYRVDGRGSLGGFNWKCECGALSGRTHAGECCVECDGIVVESLGGANRWSCACGAVARVKNTKEWCPECRASLEKRDARRPELSRIHVSLPISVVHPWRYGEAAALLGLTREELASLLSKHGPESVIHLMNEALSRAPTAAIRHRMGTQEGDVLRALGQGLFGLRRFLKNGRGVVTLNQVPVVPARFLLCGRVPGSPRLIHGGLLERYRAVLLAKEQAERSTTSASRALRVSSGIALQDAVQELYGHCDRAGSVDSLANLAARVWPLSRSGSLRTAVPSIAICDERLTVTVPIAPQKDGREVREALPLPCRLGGLPTTASFWEDRTAYARLNGPLLLRIAGVFAGLQFSRLDDTTRARLEMLGIEPGDDVDAIGCRELLRAITRPQSRCVELVSVFESPLPIQLPAEPEATRERLLTRLDSAIPYSDPGSDLAKELLAFALGGWWLATPTPDHPTGWRREFPSSSLALPWRRAIPPLTSRAWTLWSDMEAFSNPIRWLLDGEPGGLLVSNALGKLVSTPRSQWWTKSEEEVEPPPHVEGQPEDPHDVHTEAPTGPVPERRPDQGVRVGANARVLRTSIFKWLSSSATGQSEEKAEHE